MNEWQNAIIQAAEEKRKQQLDKEIEIRTQIISSAYSHAATYTNLIIFAGYAGTFTLWSFTKEYLPEKPAIIIAFMVGVSLFVFCGWEVFKMIKSSMTLRRQTEILLRGLNPDAFEKAINAEKIQANKDSISLHRKWLTVLVVTITFGFGGALLMFYNFFANITGLPYWPS